MSATLSLPTAKTRSKIYVWYKFKFRGFIYKHFHKSNTYKNAKEEIDLMLKTVDKPVIRDYVPEILSLCNKFGKSGQSGGSAPITARMLSTMIEKLLLQMPINPVTNTPEKWFDHGNGVFQNKRCGAIFKQGDNGKPYYLDAIVWKNDKGIGFSGSALLDGKRIMSKQFIKSFPFTPKTFYIDIDEKEISKDNWEFYVKDPKQLEEVFKYYEQYLKE